MTDPRELTRPELIRYCLQLQDLVKYWQMKYSDAVGAQWEDLSFKARFPLENFDGNA